MSSVVDSLILDLLEWLAQTDRPYEQVMSAWRTSCPRLPVWEDACDQGLVATVQGTVRITPAGRTLLKQRIR
jgi:hypothetical protein